jgi:hypothetical protein
MRGLESVRRRALARCPLFEPGVVNGLECAGFGPAQDSPAISAS